MNKELRKNLNFLDILVLTLLFFGIPIWQSVSMFIQSLQTEVTAGFDFNQISDQMQWYSIFQELLVLAIAFLYLHLRKFDFRQLNFKVNKWTLPLFLVLVITGAGISDVGMYTAQAVFPQTAITSETEQLSDSTYQSYVAKADEYIATYYDQVLDSAAFVEQGYKAEGYSAYLDQCDEQLAAFVREYEAWKSSFQQNAQREAATGNQVLSQNLTSFPEINFLTVLFAFLNGFYEELFFLGLIFLADKKALPWALILSVLVRFSFHMYQGIPAAVGITCMGLLFMLLRKRVKSLTPFTLAHSFFDVFGVTLWFWISMLIQ